jgi:hypothetical protein
MIIDFRGTGLYQFEYSDQKYNKSEDYRLTIKLQAMKKSIAIILFCMVIGGVYAQPEFDLGLKAGLNNSRITNNLNEFNSETIIAWHLGAFARIGWDRVYFQPEAYFSTKGGDLKEVASHTITSFDYNTFDVPALVGFKIINKDAFNIRAMAGPVFSFMTSGKVSGDDLFDKEFYRNNFYGWQYGLGADLLFMTLDARIENSSNRIYSSPNLKSRNNTFFISVGVKLF